MRKKCSTLFCHLADGTAKIFRHHFMQSLVKQLSPLMDLSSNIKGGMGGEEERRAKIMLLNLVINMISHD